MINDYICTLKNAFWDFRFMFQGVFIRKCKSYDKDNGFALVDALNVESNPNNATKYDEKTTFIYDGAGLRFAELGQ